MVFDRPTNDRIDRRNNAGHDYPLGASKLANPLGPSECRLDLPERVGQNNLSPMNDGPFYQGRDRPGITNEYRPNHRRPFLDSGEGNASTSPEVTLSVIPISFLTSKAPFSSISTTCP